MKVSNRRYKVSLVGRVNNRYYLIKISNQEYIIDYSNPKDVRTYLFGLFPKYNTEYPIYKVDNASIKTTTWRIMDQFQGSLLEYSIGIVLVFLLILPKHINPLLIFNNSIIRESWYLWLSMIFCGAILLISFLIFKSNTDEIPILVDEKSILRRVEEPRKSFIKFPQKIVDFLSCFLGIPICLFMGVASSNFILLIVFGCLGFYQLLFARFFNLLFVVKRHKFYIVK